MSKSPETTVAKFGVPTSYKGVNFRSRLEATWAAFFDRLSWQWEYEPFDLNGWIPDFALKSAMLLPEPLLVEVKPIFELCSETVHKIDRAECDYEVLLVGIGPQFERFEPPESRELNTGVWKVGWLREKWEGESDWGSAIIGRWTGSESETKNPAGIMGFCHESGSFQDRITGCYDGGCYGDGNVGCEPHDLWARAKNSVQWRGRI